MIVRFGLTTALPGLERRLQWKTRLSRSGVIRYIVFETVWWTALRASAIRRTRRRIANPPLLRSGTAAGEKSHAWRRTIR